MRSFIVVTLVAVCALAAGAPAASAKPPVKQERYLAWVEADVTDSWRSHRRSVEGGCTKTSSHGLTQKLALRSHWQSVLVATHTKGGGKAISLGGKLRALVGTLTGSGSGADWNSCTLYGVVTDYGLPMMSPIEIYDASLDVRADRGKPVAFSNLRGIFMPGGTERPADDFVNALGRAPAALTAQQLREAKFRKVDVTGSYNFGTTSADGTEVRSMIVNWKLTIRALPAKPR